MIHVLLPAFNEGRALPPVLDGIRSSLPAGGFRVWVVDDGSTDDTAAAAQAWADRLPVTVLRHGQNRGLGQAFRTGLDALWPHLSDEDILVTLDADDTQPSAMIPQLAAPLAANDADIAIASRFAPGGQSVGVPFYRRVTSLSARALMTLLFPVPGVRDYTCGFRAYRGDLLRRAAAGGDVLINESGFAVSLEWLLRLSRHRPRVVEVPLVLRYDKKPTPSKMPVARTIFRTLALVWRLRRTR